MAAFGDGFQKRNHSTPTIERIKHDHQEIVKKYALEEKNKADNNLKEMSVYLKMGEEHETFGLDTAKYTTSLRSQMIESNVPTWTSYPCTYFGQAPLMRYPRPSALTFDRMKFLISVNSSIVEYIMSFISQKTILSGEDKEEWMYTLCKQTMPVLSYISKVEKFTNGVYASLIFEAHPFEIPHENNAKIYVVLTTNSKMAGDYLVTDYFFYYFQ